MGQQILVRVGYVTVLFSIIVAVFEIIEGSVTVYVLWTAKKKKKVCERSYFQSILFSSPNYLK